MPAKLLYICETHIRGRKSLVGRVLDWRFTGHWFNPSFGSRCLRLFLGVGELGLLWLVGSWTLPLGNGTSKWSEPLSKAAPPKKKIYPTLGHKCVERSFSQCKYIHYMDRKADLCRSELGCSEVWGFHGPAAVSQCGVAKAGAKCHSSVKDSDTGSWSRTAVKRCSMEWWVTLLCLAGSTLPARLWGLEEDEDGMGWMGLLFRRSFQASNFVSTS